MEIFLEFFDFLFSFDDSLQAGLESQNFFAVFPGVLLVHLVLGLVVEAHFSFLFQNITFGLASFKIFQLL